ncbi:methyl-accepting chemotaxis protein [Spirillospora sp. CA-253888]
MSLLRNLGVGKRLGLSFLTVTMLIAVAVGIGHWQMARQEGISTRIDQLRQVKDDVQTFAYHVADLTGWQGLVVADAGAVGGRSATDPNSYNRKGELQSKKDLYATLDNTHAQYLTPAERAQFDRLRPAWDEFFVADEKVMELLRRDTREARVAALENINGGPAGEAWDQAVKISRSLDESLDARAAALQAEAEDVRTTGRDILLFTLLVAVALAVALSVVVTRSVVRPLAKAVATLRRVAAGDLTARADLDRSDELGMLGAALDETTRSLRDTVSAVVSHSTTLAGASTQMLDVAERIAASAEETSAQATVVAAAAGDVSRNVETVAAGGEEMGLSIREISHSTSEAVAVTSEAVVVTEATGTTMSKLEQSSAQISNVVKLINSIAEQTNLLALNATIEAARAGDAGKGFAVVAGEVKDLAQETAKATEDISRRVDTIQNDTAAAMEAIGRISTITGRINDYQATIAAAVEEQTATTAEMNRNVTEAATTSSDIAANISGVAEASAATTAGAEQSRQAAVELAEMSRALHDLVGRFTT